MLPEIEPGICGNETEPCITGNGWSLSGTRPALMTTPHSWG